MQSGETHARTNLLHSWSEGDTGARNRLFDIFYPELCQAAAGLLRNERAVSLSSGDLVHETVIRLVQLKRIEWTDRAHFMAMASRFMRRALVDHVRSKQRNKRDHIKVELTTRFAAHRPIDLQKLDHALLRLAALDQEKADIVEMRYFGGMTFADIAEVLPLSEPTIKRRWSVARIWLLEAIENPL
jgi:RNA polymerase sigma factor (TIGR02999 family)